MAHTQFFKQFAPTTLGKVSALTEVLSVFFIGSVLSMMFFQFAGVTGHPLMALLEPNANLFEISWDLFNILMMQYAGWFILIIVCGLMFSRPFIRESGLSRKQHSLLWLVAIGVLGWAIGDIPSKIVWLLDAEYDLGTSVPWREALISGEKTAGWWTLMAVGSFAIIPIIEEVFWRGYVQARLQNSFSPSIAIIATALMFTLSHAQYHQMDAYHIATICALFINALIFGWLFYSTGSLLPAIVMHALVNFPTDGAMMYIVIGLMFSISAWKWKTIRMEIDKALNKLNLAQFDAISLLAFAILAMSMMALSQFPTLTITIGYVAAAILSLCFIYARWRSFSLATEKSI
ncbi:CPBP family intramembrane glutamic endopeptidase [Alteromonas facilis]|uniref:CPBP family intramembrane glutamic endopeptidase n=1 Tax=Alteromonas facilis TaxID=2048004 RepID=UPI000C29064F|nr:type II CAAX endopeptidase family protein [Alteromonas facilis]